MLVLLFNPIGMFVCGFFVVVNMICLRYGDTILLFLHKLFESEALYSYLNLHLQKTTLERQGGMQMAFKFCLFK